MINLFIKYKIYRKQWDKVITKINSENNETKEYTLFKAVQSNKKNAAKKLLEDQAQNLNLNTCHDIRDRNQYFTIDYAIENNMGLELIQKLIEHGAKPSNITLKLAIKYGTKDIIKTIMSNGADINKLNYEILALRFTEVIDIVHAQYSNKATMALNNELEIAPDTPISKALLAFLGTKTREKEEAIIMPNEKMLKKMAKTIIENDKDWLNPYLEKLMTMTKPDEEICFLALRHNNKKNIDIILENTSNEQRELIAITALEMEEPNFEHLEAIIKTIKPADSNSNNKNQSRIVFELIRLNKPDMAEKLIKGADLNGWRKKRYCQRGIFTIDYAVDREMEPKFIQKLIEHGAKPSNFTLELAIKHGNKDTIDIIINHINKTEAVFSLIELNKPDIAEKLLEGVDLNVHHKVKFDTDFNLDWKTKEQKFFSIDYAVKNEMEPEFIQKLIEYGAKPSDLTLAIAMKHGNKDIIKTIMSNGADINKLPYTMLPFKKLTDIIDITYEQHLYLGNGTREEKTIIMPNKETLNYIARRINDEDKLNPYLEKLMEMIEPDASLYWSALINNNKKNINTILKNLKNTSNEQKSLMAIRELERPKPDFDRLEVIIKNIETADSNSYNKNQSQLVFKLVQLNQPTIAEQILKGANLNNWHATSQYEIKYFTIDYAVKNEMKPEFIQKLIEHGAKPSITTLNLAIKHGNNQENINTILEHMTEEQKQSIEEEKKEIVKIIENLINNYKGTNTKRTSSIRQIALLTNKDRYSVIKELQYIKSDVMRDHNENGFTGGITNSRLEHQIDKAINKLNSIRSKP